MSRITVDAARLPVLLGEMRLPTFARLWTGFAETADAERWPAARFLATLAEHEVAERQQRRIARHAQAGHLAPGKTFDAFDFAAVPMVSKATAASARRTTRRNASCAVWPWAEKHSSSPAATAAASAPRRCTRSLPPPS